MDVQLLRDLLVDAIVPPRVPDPDGPRQCCSDWAIVTECNGEIDLIECSVCGYRYEAPCR